MASEAARRRVNRKDAEDVDRGQDAAGEMEDQRGTEDPDFAYICVKVGTKYQSGQVNALYRMCRENGPDAPFYCVTEDPEGLLPDVRVLDPVEPRFLKGWFQKLGLFAGS